MADDLNARISDAHARNDKDGLIKLYHQAAQDSQDADETCFFLTYAYIFALETGHPLTHDLAQKLQSYGRL